MSNELKTGSFVYEDGIYSVKGNSKYDLENNKFENADGSIFKEDKVIGYFSTYKEYNTNEVKANISNIELALLVEVTNMVTDCLQAIDDYYNA